MIDVQIKDGKVYNEDDDAAVLISKGYGAGWSTENDQDCLYTPEIVMALLEEREITEEFCDKVYGEGFYGGGKDGLEVVWVPKDSVFRVEEYDGAERLEFTD